MASAYDMLGSIDSNTGSPDLGWDTDQFPMDVKNATMIMKVRDSLHIRKGAQEKFMILKRGVVGVSNTRSLLLQRT